MRGKEPTGEAARSPQVNRKHTHFWMGAWWGASGFRVHDQSSAT